jgi:hypothetical protein
MTRLDSSSFLKFIYRMWKKFEFHPCELIDHLYYSNEIFRANVAYLMSFSYVPQPSYVPMLWQSLGLGKGLLFTSALRRFVSKLIRVMNLKPINQPTI